MTKTGKEKAKAVVTKASMAKKSAPPIEEIWKPTHVSNLYEVSSQGRVRRTETGNLRKKSTNPHGYNVLTLHIHGKLFTYLVARLVLGAFVRAPVAGEKAHHINGRSTNDFVDNLKWTSIGEAGANRSFPLTLESKSVVATSENGEEVHLFASALEAASFVDTSRVAIYDAIRFGRLLFGYTFDYDAADEPTCEVRSVRGSTSHLVSSDGRVRMQSGRWTFGSRHWKATGDGKDNEAYRRIEMTLLVGGKRVRKKKYVHVVVAEAFIGECPMGHQVDHIDGNPSNNDASNLEYVSKSENNRRAFVNNGRKPPGEKAVLLIKRDGTFSKFKSISEGGRHLGVEPSGIGINCKTGRANRDGDFWAYDLPVIKPSTGDVVAQVYESLTDASRVTGESLLSILRSCRNTCDESWKYVE